LACCGARPRVFFRPNKRRDPLARFMENRK
jgi:hypothetical protein